jgi:hypothetical protein
MYARRTTGSWSPLKAVDYRERPETGRLVLLVAGLSLWFLFVLVVSIAVLDEWLADNVFSWLPDSLLQFAVVEEDGDEIAGGELVAFILVALAFNGVAGPVTEELYSVGICSRALIGMGAGLP